MSDVLARRDRALTPEETQQLLREHLGDQVEHAVQEYGVFTLWVANEAYAEAARLCRYERLLAYDMFDCLFGVDAREEGFDVVAVLYSTSTGNRIALRTRCAGGREDPTCPSMTDVYRGADWMERETWDMFGIRFLGHPGLEPRLLLVENFEGWPLRKDFHLTSRVVKPWPGVNEPAELDEEGNVIEREPQLGDAPGPYDLDKAMAEQARARNAPPQVEQPDAAADDEVDDQQATAEADEDTAGEPGPDPAGVAAERAEQRRQEQAQARARKAAERARDTEGSDDDGEADA